MNGRRTPSTGRPRRPGRRSPGRAPFLGAALVLLAVGGWFGWRYLKTGAILSEPELPSSLPAVVGEPAGDRAVVLVFPEWDAAGYVTEQRLIPSRARPEEDLLGLMTQLCRGPRISGAVSALPTGTRALAAFYDADTGEVVLDFSQELVVGHPGGSAAETATLTSILRSVGLSFPDASSCIILVEGAQVETLAGHLMLDRPLELRRFL